MVLLAITVFCGILQTAEFSEFISTALYYTALYFTILYCTTLYVEMNLENSAVCIIPQNTVIANNTIKYTET